jgi:hypothetical protein
MCIVSRCIATQAPEDIYWIGAAQAWQYPQMLDGKIGRFKKLDNWNQDDRKTFDLIVDNGEMITVALPLVEITSSDKLESLLIEPVLSYKPWPLTNKP